MQSHIDYSSSLQSLHTICRSTAWDLITRAMQKKQM
jgi:hypothetical protein